MSMHREAEKKNVKLKPYGVELRECGYMGYTLGDSKKLSRQERL